MKLVYPRTEDYCTLLHFQFWFLLASYDRQPFDEPHEIVELMDGKTETETLWYKRLLNRHQRFAFQFPHRDNETIRLKCIMGDELTTLQYIYLYSTVQYTYAGDWATVISVTNTISFDECWIADTDDGR